MTDSIDRALDAGLADRARQLLADQRVRDALLHAQDWIGSVPHGDNCYVSNHYAGDPGNQCNCGKESVLSSIEQALEVIGASGVRGTYKDVTGGAPDAG